VFLIVGSGVYWNNTEKALQYFHGSAFEFMTMLTAIYRVIHKSLRDFRPLPFSSRDGHAEVERVNRGRDTPSFCPTLQVFDILTSEGS